MIPLRYPSTEKKDTAFHFFGTDVHDPYQWLENDNSSETLDWVEQQNTLTRSFLDNIPFRKAIRDRYAALFNFEKVGIPYKAGNYFFIFKNSGLEPQGKYFVREGLQGDDRVFLDVNALSADGSVAAELLGDDEQHRYMAVTVNESGSDWGRIWVYDIATGKKLNDELRWIKFSGAAWYGDGFFYSRYPEPKKGEEFSGNNRHHMVYYHKLGTDQQEDVLIYTNADRPDFYHNSFISENKRYLFVIAAPGTDGFEVYYRDLKSNDAHFHPLFSDLKYHTVPIDVNEDGTILALTDVDAPKYRLVLVDPAQPEPNAWKEIIPEDKEHLLQSVSTAGDYLFAGYLEAANTRFYRIGRDGSNRTAIGLPDLTGSASGFSAHRNEDYCFYAFTSFTYPGVIYKYDLKTNTSEVFYSPKTLFNPADFVSKQVTYKSKDGTLVPMFIVHHKNRVAGKAAPTLLYGYGGFNVPLTPAFSTSRLILLEQGGVFAMPNLRGGGEFGEDWHKAGMLDKKQNVFDDFIAAAEYLITEGYCTKELLAIEGGSNGGLLVGACMTQRPDLFTVCFPAVGVMDMLRFHHFTVGKGWIPEYGCADRSKEEFENLFSYSPYHQLKDGTAYPSTMIMTADHDDRVVPAHSFKFAARGQACQTSDAPFLIRIQKSAGHGAGASTEKIIEEQTDKWTFFFHCLGFNYR